MYIFFFKQKTAYEMRISDWSSDVCSSDLEQLDNRIPLRRADQLICLHQRRDVLAQRLLQFLLVGAGGDIVAQFLAHQPGHAGGVDLQIGLQRLEMAIADPPAEAADRRRADLKLFGARGRAFEREQFTVAHKEERGRAEWRDR